MPPEGYPQWNKEERKLWEKTGVRDYVSETFQERVQDVGNSIRQRLGLDVIIDIPCEVVGSKPLEP